MTRHLKLLFVIPSLRPYGGQRVALDLAEAVVKLGCEVTFCTWHDMEGDRQRVGSAGGDYLHLEGSLLTRTLALRKIMQSRKFDATVAFMNIANTLAAGAAISTRMPLVLTEHNIPSIALPQGDQHPRSMLASIKTLYRRADAIVGVSDAVAADLVAMGVNYEKVSRIYNPIDVPRLKRSAEEVRVSADPNLLLSVGALKSAKGHDLTIKALAGLPENYKLVIAGDGDHKGQLDHLVSELGLRSRVTFLGFVANPYGLMASARLHVIASKFEGFGLVVPEAASLGTRTVAVDSPGLGEIARLADSVMSSNRTPESFCDAIERALRMSANPSVDSLDAFRPDLVAGRYLVEIEKAMTRRSGLES